MVATFDHRFCFVGFGTDRLRRQEAMKTAGGENPNRYTTALVAFRVYGTEAENNSAQSGGLDVENKSGHGRSVFFFTPFIELLRVREQRTRLMSELRQMEVEIALLVGSLGLASGTFTLQAFRWEYRF